MIIEIGRTRNTTAPCPDCKKAYNHAPGFAIVKGIPVPGDCKLIGGATKPTKYPWKDMDIGDMWEYDLSGTSERNSVLGSLRYHERKYGQEFAYRLTTEKGTTTKGLEIWRVK